MNLMNLKRQVFTIAVLTGLATSAFAKDVNLYDQPQTNAKVIGTIDFAKGVVPIFTPKDGTWVKVGDPNNGNVGWVKQSDLNTNTGPVSISQQVITTEQGPKTYVIKLNPPENLTPEQIKEIQKRQQILQQSIRNMTESFNSLFQQNLKVPANIPILVPVMIPDTSVSPTQSKPATVNTNQPAQNTNTKK